MIGTSLPELVFIRICILALRVITPLSIFYLSFCIADPPSSVAGKFLLAYCAFEAAFWLLVFIPRKRSLQSAAVHPPTLPYEERKALFWKCWDKIPNPDYFLSKWFLGARPHEIGRENVKDFYRWALLNKGDEGRHVVKAEEVERRVEEEQELEEYVDGIETLTGQKIEPGRGPAKSLRLTIDDVKMLHRPLLWYMVIGLVDSLTAAYLFYNKFQLYGVSLRRTFSIFPFRLANLCTRKGSASPDLSYWYRPHTSQTRLPVLFIHGISIGLYSYAQFLTEITKHDPKGPEDGEIGIIAIEAMPISFRITEPILDRDQFCRQILQILNTHSWDKVVLASHSYGSVITTHLLQNPDTRSRIGPSLFVDPVTFLLHLPDVAYNFTARKPKRANERQLHYFACTDMMVSHALARHFFWAQNILWEEDVRGRDVTVSLGGRDLIVDTETVGKYIAGIDMKSEDSSWKERAWTGNGLETLWFPTCDHAQVFERAEGRRRLGDVLRKYSEQKIDEEEEDFP
ncbi:hypothetical protein BU24DRAFT_497245 [Aaosphaeria arxii CBS 175.79]|uniref:AB hydrolase-1 domain-containing protein n=1 Tax=Aaosphaeria arxii CBS 175.79 TaxID=1450172 RepID=A0A6A5X9C7_9PLEO|nr:uncharacterized protein BU24DRAFT_497245 [Aaosphaeria arxii CBS 175.79]KAF2009665.1 hypothetical protein BU24DRAFT_497245 [Aaosphaeria arxii CBS 175.79]